MKAEGAAKALGILFFLVLCWPFVRVADRAAVVLGVPALLLYLFAGWSILILVLAAVARRLGE